MSEPPGVYSRLNPKARKPHRCCECGGVIPKGERYFKHLCCYSGDGWFTFKNCFVCEEVREAFEKEYKFRSPVNFYALYEEVESRGGALYVKFMTNQHSRGKPLSEEQMECVMEEALS